MMRDPLPLAHCGVLVTRPVHQAQGVQARLRALGAMPFLFPTLDIQPVEGPAPLNQVAKALDQWDCIIFTSVNAVWHSLPVLSDLWPVPPPWLKVVAIGKSTADALEDYQWAPHITPSKQYSSEGLLALRDFQQVKGKRILIIEGANGRGYLEGQLKEKGGIVQPLAVYRRQCPQVDVTPLLHYWEGQAIQCVMITSGDSLKNLIQLLGASHAHYWKETLMCVISERVARLAKTQGAKKVVVAQKATDEGMVEALVQWYGQHQHE